MDIKVTVIIPIYNMEQYLAECIETVMSQTLQEIEILCINDGSTDQSLQILQKYSENDTRFVIINQNNQGVAASRNKGIQIAKGKYVMFMDPDDRYPNCNVIQKLYEAVENNNVKIAGGEFSDFDPEGNVNSRSDYENDMLGGYLFETNQIMKYRDYQFDYGYHRFIYNRKFLLDNNLFFPELIRFQDPPFMVRAFTLAENFFALTDITYCYRLNYKTISWDEKRVDALLRGLQMNLQWAREHEMYDLYNLTIRRIIYEYKEPITKQFTLSIPNERLLLAILGDLQGNEQIKSLMWMVIETYQIMNVKSQEEVQLYKESMQELNNCMEKLKEEIVERDEDIKKNNHMIEVINKKYVRQKEETSRMRNSLSYKLGRLITWTPRMVRRNIAKLIRQGG